MCIYIYIRIDRERERETQYKGESARGLRRQACTRRTCGLRPFIASVHNPESQLHLGAGGHAESSQALDPNNLQIWTNFSRLL